MVQSVTTRLGVVVFALVVSSVPAVAAPPACFTLAASNGTIRVTQSRMLADLFQAPVADDFPLVDGTLYRAEVQLVSKGRSRKVITRMSVTPANAQTSSPRKITILFGGDALDADLGHLVVCNAEAEPFW